MPTPPRSRHRRCRPGGDRGSVTTEMVLSAPLLFGLVLVGVQFALWALAQLGVQHAANHSLQITRVGGGSVAAGQADATAVLAQVAGRMVDDSQVTVTRDADTATVTVQARVVAVVPFLRLSVSTTVSAPVERFRPQTLTLGPRWR